MAEIDEILRAFNIPPPAPAKPAPTFLPLLLDYDTTRRPPMPQPSHGAATRAPEDMPSLTSSAASCVSVSLPATPTAGPPPNFATVVPGAVYRSAMPSAANFEHLAQLRLRTVVTLVAGEPYPAGYVNFLARANIRHVVILLPAHKCDADRIPDDKLAAVHAILADEAQHPVLVHCNKGKHRTGCVMATYRLARGWALERAVEEYRVYAGAKRRELDERYLGAWTKPDGDEASTARPLSQSSGTEGDESVRGEDAATMPLTVAAMRVRSARARQAEELGLPSPSAHM